MSETYKDHMVRLATRYYEEHGKENFETKDAAVWLVKRRLWKMPDTHAIKRCQEDLAKYLRQATIAGKDGIPTRQYAVLRRQCLNEKGKLKQKHLWFDVRVASRAEVFQSFLQRRNQCGADVASLKHDIASYNVNWVPAGDTPIQMSFNFDGDDAAGETAA